MTSYVPHPATIAHKAIQHLKTHPPGKQVASKPLADAIETDSSTLLACMVTACKHGLVKREKKDGLIFFSLGNNVPVPVPDDDEPPRQVVRPVRPRAATRAAGVDMDHVHATRPASHPAPVPEPEPVLVAMEPAPFVFSWRSDGVVTVAKGGATVVMEPAEYSKLMRFLLAIRGLKLNEGAS